MAKISLYLLFGTLYSCSALGFNDTVEYNREQYDEISYKLITLPSETPLADFQARLAIENAPFDDLYPNNTNYGLRLYHLEGFGLYVSYKKQGDQLITDKFFAPEIYIDGLDREQRMKMQNNLRGDYYREKANR